MSGLAGRRRYSCKAARHVKRLALLQNVKTGPRQLVRQRLDRYHVICPRFLALVEAFGLSVVAQRKVGRLDKGPGQWSIRSVLKRLVRRLMPCTV